MTQGKLVRPILVALSVLLLAACGLRVSPEARMSRAESQIAKGDFQGAIIELREVLNASPSDSRALLLAARASLGLGSFERAVQYAKAAAAAGAPGADAMQVQVDGDLALGHFEAVLRDIDAGKVVLPEQARGIARAQALLGLHRYEEAGAAFGSVVEHDPRSVHAKLGLARVQLARGELARAVSDLDALLSRHPDSAEAWWVRGTVHGTRGEFAQMEQALTKADQLGAVQLNQQQRIAVLAGLVEARLAQSHIEGAAKAQAELARLAPGALVTPYMAGRIALARQDYTGAVDVLTRLVGGVPDFAPGRFLLGSALLAQGHLNQAELHLARVVSETPDNDEARKLLAQVRMRLDRPAEAVQALSSRDGADADDPQIRALLGIAQLKSGDQAGGLTSLERGVREKPDDPSLRRALVAAYVATGQKSKATNFLKQVLERRPDDIVAHVGLAEIALRDGDRAAAIEYLEDGVRRSPGSTDARLLLQRLYLRDRQTTKADALASQTLVQSANRAEVLAAMGSIDMEAGRYDQALGRFREASERDPGNATIWLSLGRAQLALNQPAARESVAKALQLRPVWLAAVAAMSLIDLRAGNGAAALERVAQARKAAPEQPGFAQLEGDLRMALKQPAEALKSYEAENERQATGVLAVKLYQARQAAGVRPSEQPLRDWVQKHPDDLVVRSVLADAYQVAGQIDKAIAEYEALARSPNVRPAVLNNLAWSYFLAGDSRAIGAAKDAYLRESANPAIADTYGWILLETARLTEGAQILKVAAQAAPANPDIQFHYASALARLGQKQEAQQRLRTVLSSSKGFASRGAAERLMADLTGAP